MKAGDLGELALRNLREAVLRSSLTTLGVAVGVASLVAWLSLGIGLQALATKRLSNSGLFDTVIVTQRRNAQSMRRPPAESSPAKNARLSMMMRKTNWNVCRMLRRFIRRFAFQPRCATTEILTRRSWRGYRCPHREMDRSMESREAFFQDRMRTKRFCRLSLRRIYRRSHPT